MDQYLQIFRMHVGFYIDLKFIRNLVKESKSKRKNDLVKMFWVQSKYRILSHSYICSTTYFSFPLTESSFWPLNILANHLFVYDGEQFAHYKLVEKPGRLGSAQDEIEGNKERKEGKSDYREEKGGGGASLTVQW